MALADQIVSPQFTSHDWPEHGPSGPKAFRDYHAAIRSAVPDARYEVDDLIAEHDRGHRSVCRTLTANLTVAGRLRQSRQRHSRLERHRRDDGLTRQRPAPVMIVAVF